MITLPLAMIGPELALARAADLEHLRFPHQLAGPRVDGVHAVVGACVDDRRAPHRHVAVGAAVDALGILALVLPHQVAGLRVDRHDESPGFGMYIMPL